MKLAIASTTLLFAMMAAQAAVLSTTSSTDVNLVKRAPTSDDEADVEQSDMAGQSSSDPISQLPLSKHEKEKFDMLYGKLSSEFKTSVDLVLERNSEIEALKDYIEKLKKKRGRKPSAKRTRINASIAASKKKLAKLEFQFREMMTKREPQANVYRELKKAQPLSTSIAHLVVECEQVTGHRIQSGLVPAIQKSRLRLLGRALDPGVENVYTWLRGGVLNGEADLDQRWLDGTVEHEFMGTRHDNRVMVATVDRLFAGSVPAVSIHIVEIPPGSPCGSWLTDF
ncbi:hypothetical protein BASA60_007457 [Batrachochytrium salamandrivorans]|nr:hypothetical protein BASA60_007457 [Batrachochytrium salamandrivorans]